MISKPIYVILDAGGYPYLKTASSNKFYMMGKALQSEGFRVVLLNNVNPLKTTINKSDSIDFIEYSFLTTNIRNSVLSKIITAVKANLTLIPQLIKLKSKKSFLHISPCSLSLVLYYRVICWLLGYRLIFSLMEYNPNIPKTISQKINFTTFWNISIYFADGAIPISELIFNLVNAKSKNLPLLKIPALADFDSSLKESSISNEKYFCYCGNIGYEDVIKLIINAFKDLNNQNMKLHLIISGKMDAIEKLKSEIASFSNIEIFQNLSNNDLFKMFSGAIGLLMPMRPCIQDEARFPQKAAEYVASGAPIITNSIGEISYYFKANDNAIFAKDYTKEAYCAAMKWVIENPNNAREIGINGRNTGHKHFHYKNIAKRYSDFLYSI